MPVPAYLKVLQKVCLFRHPVAQVGLHGSQSDVP